MRKHILAAVAVLCCIGMMACGGDTSAEPAKDSAKDTVQESTTKDTAGKDDEKDTPAGNEDTPAGNEDAPAGNEGAPAATKEPEATKAPEVTKPAEDILAFEVELDGESYKFPMWFDDFEKMGWTYVEDGWTNDKREEEVSPSWGGNCIWEKDGLRINTHYYNGTINMARIDECLITGFSMLKYERKEFDGDIVFPGGIKVGEATKDEIISVYGEPFYVYEGSEYEQLTYQRLHSGQKIEFCIYYDTGILETVEVRNEEKLPGGNNEVSLAVPDFVELYQAPAFGVGDEDHLVFELDGKGYELPVPVAVLFENGFSVTEEYMNMAIPAESFVKVPLRYGNTRMEVQVNNYAKYATVLQNGMVTYLNVDDYQNKVDISVLGGIKVGSTLDEVKAIVEKYSYETDKSHEGTDFSSTSYQVANPEHTWYNYNIYCDDKDGVVSMITISKKEKPSYGTGEPTDKMAEMQEYKVSDSSVFAFWVAVEGDKMTMPMAFSDLEALGWTFEGDATEVIAAKSSETTQTWQKGNLRIYTVLRNGTDGDLPKSECSVVEVTFGRYESLPFYEADEYNGDVQTPSGVKFYTSTKEDIVAAYGTPTYEYESDIYYHVTYSLWNGRKAEFWLSKETGVLYRISVCNY